jgi:hypothetical protein
MNSSNAPNEGDAANGQMLSHTFRRLLISAAALLSMACSREGQIKGDIFIVTKGHQSVKLGLVEVAAIPASDVRRVISERRAKIAGAQKRLSEIDAEYQKLGVSDTADYDDVSRLTPHDHDKFVELSSERKQLMEPYNLMFEDLPPPRSIAKSDADGHFRLVLPSGDYFLVAQSERQVFNKTEHYYWCVSARATPHADQTVTLSNDNELGYDSLEFLVRKGI